MSLVGYRTHSITLRAANMRRGVLVNSAAARRFAFFTKSAKYLLQKSGSWIKTNPELKCRERRAGDGPRAPAIDEGNSQNRERNENMNQTQTRSLRKKVLSLILAVVMAVSLLPISAFASGNSKASTTDNTDYYKILHLDCGRKYFSKDWIIALLNEMSADGYNQLQLAFGNDGLRFLLDDMSFTANGTTYSHKTVVSKVEAGNKLQNSSGDASWLTQTEMDEIIAAAKEKGIEIVPLLNLPGHANAILDIADDTYNASGSNNTLNVASNEKARNFGMATFKKYVDYFAGKGCKFFNFGADEYANDASGTFSFSRLNSTQYAETEQVVAQKVRLPMRAMALRMNGESINGMGTSVVANGFNADGTLNVGSTGSVTERTITVAVGGTKTVTADGYYNGSYATGDTTIATASAVGTAAVDRTENEVTTIESGKQYLIVHKRSGLVLNDSTSGNGILLGEKANSSDQLWTITKYSSSRSNAYTIQGVAKNYITEIGRGSATLGTSNGYVQMAYNSNGYWNIYDAPYWTGTNYYLNQYGGASSTMAAGYKTTEDWSEGKGQVALTFAVVYPDGTVSPAEGSMYASSTTIFNYWDGRDIGIVAPKNNSDYNIAKITVTDGKRDSNSSANVWYTTDTITWNKKTNVAGEKWYDETEVWNKSSGTTPMVNGKTSNITWSAKNTAKLVLIYLEPIEKETNLNVQYIDLNANNHVFHSKRQTTPRIDRHETIVTGRCETFRYCHIGGIGMTSAELKHRAKLQEWAARIQDCRSSGLSVRAWCRQEEINAATYYRWERELLALAETEPCLSVSAVRFAELPAPKQVSRNVAERSATLHIGNASLDIYPGCDTEQLKMLVEFLRLC